FRKIVRVCFFFFPVIIAFVVFMYRSFIYMQKRAIKTKEKILSTARKLFAANVSRSLSPGGIWASLIGSTEGAARETGPPRRTASEVIASVEPYLEIVELKSVLFRTNFPNAPKAWLCVSRQRKEPAQPSGR
ncbi:MAG TPA: hypothetical protein PKZ74_11385, partial [Bacteroidales bacterium]|nr:hypothetical protein [Bacteroidales bacterium]